MLLRLATYEDNSNFDYYNYPLKHISCPFMATTGILLYVLSSFAVATILAAYINRRYPPIIQSQPLVLQTEKEWPDLKFSWRLVAATIIGFLGSACGTVGGVGGGGIFVPMLTMIVGFDTKSAAALSKCMIMGASGSSVWYNLRAAHPTRKAPIINYSLALLFQPMLMLGITIGVSLSVVFPYSLITLLTIVLFMSTSSRSFYKGIEMWKEETKSRNEASTNIEEEYNEPLIPQEPMTKLQLMCFNIMWGKISVLFLVWISFLTIQLLKTHVAVCSLWYWILFNLQFPVALAVFFSEAVKIYRKYQMRGSSSEIICEASIEWSLKNIALCALCSIVGGAVGGLLGSGGGFILGPLLLEIGVIPQVASATATFVMVFSSSLSVVQFYLLKRFPIPYALYLTSVSIVAGFWGQYLVRKVVGILGRASIVVFILSAVIFASALTMGAVGITKSVELIRNHLSFMEFLDFCSNQ